MTTLILVLINFLIPFIVWHIAQIFEDKAPVAERVEPPKEEVKEDFGLRPDQKPFPKGRKMAFQCQECDGTGRPVKRITSFGKCAGCFGKGWY